MRTRTRIRDAAVITSCLLVLVACSSTTAESHGLPEPPENSADDGIASKLAEKFGLPERPKNATGDPTPPMGHIAYQPPILPITFSIDASGNVRVGINANLVTLLGTVTVSGDIVRNVAGNLLPFQPADVTQLIICQEDSAGQRCEAYWIGTGRKIHIKMNGRFFQNIERNRVIIYATPGSMIEITDNGPPTKKFEAFGPARIGTEEFNFHETGEGAEVDLERSHSGVITDLSYDHITAELKSIHGAKVATFRTYRWHNWNEPDERSDYPSEQECQQRRPEDWKDVFSEEDLNVKSLIACIKTAEGDIGFLFIKPDPDQKPVAYYVYSYIWVR